MHWTNFSYLHTYIRHALFQEEVFRSCTIAMVFNNAPLQLASCSSFHLLRRGGTPSRSHLLRDCTAVATYVNRSLGHVSDLRWQICRLRSGKFQLQQQQISMQQTVQLNPLYKKLAVVGLSTWLEGLDNRSRFQFKVQSSRRTRRPAFPGGHPSKYNRDRRYLTPVDELSSQPWSPLPPMVSL